MVKAVEDGGRSFLHSMTVYAKGTNRINSVYFTDSTGTIIESSPEISSSIGHDASINPYVNNVIRTGNPVIGSGEPGFDRMPVVPLGVPVKNGNDTVIGVMVGTVTVANLPGWSGARLPKTSNISTW